MFVFFTNLCFIHRGWVKPWSYLVFSTFSTNFLLTKEKCTTQKMHGTSWRSLLNGQYFFKTHLCELIGLGLLPTSCIPRKWGNKLRQTIPHTYLGIWGWKLWKQRECTSALFSNVIQIIEFDKLKAPYFFAGIIRMRLWMEGVDHLKNLSPLEIFMLYYCSHNLG